MDFSRLARAGLVGGIVLLPSLGGTAAADRRGEDGAGRTSTPVEHVVVIFQENVSFDHYFGTYPKAENPPGEPRFIAVADTPSVNGLDQALLTANPNAANPKRLDRSQALTCDMDHGYTDEQKAFNHGLMDKFVEFASGGGCTDKTLVMDYYDGNTVTALWNYAQHFAMSDNSFGDTFGPSTPGALNLVAGQTHGATPASIPNNVSNGTVIGDPRPALDECWKSTGITMSGQNVGDVLNAHNVSWGWFQGGFRPTGTDANGKAVCGAAHKNIGGATVTDYIPHHQPFQYYPQTANPKHTPPASVDEIGHAGPANHQYDVTDFWAAADAGKLPAVSYLKAAAYQDGHAGYSDPLDEQTFLVESINRLERLPGWNSTAVIVAYDDSDGWYDHVMGPILTQSNDPTADALTGAGMCGTARPGSFQDRCGFGPRQPLLVISPFARRNFVDHSTTGQASILRFIEDNWSLGRLGNQSFDARDASLTNLFDFDTSHDDRHTPRLVLDPATGKEVR
jgi:phospholipase C